jgi:cyclopropane-fatty-acyl-phospholipid synthase
VLAKVDTDRSYKVLLQDWAEVKEPVDRIVMIEALEHFGFERYDDFFKFAYDLMPDDGVMMVHSICGLTTPQMAERGIPLTFSFARFIKFVMTDIFPGGRLPSIEKVEEHATKAGFTLTHVQSLQSDFAKTLDMWADLLESRKDEAIAIQSDEVYERYMKFLRGTADGFRIGYVDINQFTLEK